MKTLAPTQKLILKLLVEHTEITPGDLVHESKGKIPSGTIHTTLARMKDKKLVKSRKPKNRVRRTWSIAAEGKRKLKAG